MDLQDMLSSFEHVYIAGFPFFYYAVYSIYVSSLVYRVFVPYGKIIRKPIVAPNFPCSKLDIIYKCLNYISNIATFDGVPTSEGD